MNYNTEGYIRPITFLNHDGPVALIHNDNRDRDSDKGRESGIESEEEEEETESHAIKEENITKTITNHNKKKTNGDIYTFFFINLYFKI